MAVDKEALICLSRVYSYYFKCNFPLFYVYPALTRYLSILFLNILTLLACTHSSDNLFHTLDERKEDSYVVMLSRMIPRSCIRITRNYQIVKYRCNGGHLEFSGTIWPDMHDLVTE